MILLYLLFSQLRLLLQEKETKKKNKKNLFLSLHMKVN